MAETQAARVECGPFATANGTEYVALVYHNFEILGLMLASQVPQQKTRLYRRDEATCVLLRS